MLVGICQLIVTAIYCRKRKNVIVRTSSPKSPVEKVGKKNEEKTNEEEEEKENLIAQIQTFEYIKLDIDVPAIHEMCTKYLVQEERSHLETIKVTFSTAWQECSQGERPMAEYISCCQNKKELTPEFFQLCTRQFRKRCLNFICNLDLGLDITADTAYNLFKNNLGRAELLGYLHTFNLPDWASQLDFVLGQKDKEQWQARDPRISGMSLSMVMQFMPLLEETKLELYTEFMGLTLPIFKDTTVITLMLLITIFDHEGNVRVKQIKNGFLAILHGYLQEHTVNFDDFDMQNITRCITALPRVYRIFKEIRVESETETKSQK